MTTLYIGTYTRGTASQGIYRTVWNARQRAFAPATLAAVADNPSFLIRHGDHLLAVHETADFEGREQGAVAAYACAGSTLRALWIQGTGGADPCHLAASDGVLAVANYSGASVACFDFDDVAGPDGPGGRLRWLTAFEGSSGVPGTRRRQAAPHPHGVYFEGNALWVPDLGQDCVHRLTLDGQADAKQRWRFPPGSGPRQLALATSKTHPNATAAPARVYVLHELANRVDLLEEGVLRQSVSTLANATPAADPSAARSTAGSIALAPEGDVLFVSNRGFDSMATFRVDPGTGHLAEPILTPCDPHPRHFAVLDDVVIVASRDAGTLTAFARVKGVGLGPTLASVEVPAAVCVLPW